MTACSECGEHERSNASQPFLKLQGGGSASP